MLTLSNFFWLMTLVICLPLFLESLISPSIVHHIYSRFVEKSNYIIINSDFREKQMRNVTQSHTIHASRFFLKLKKQKDKQNMMSSGELCVVVCQLKLPGHVLIRPRFCRLS